MKTFEQCVIEAAGKSNMLGEYRRKYKAVIKYIEPLLIEAADIYAQNKQSHKLAIMPVASEGEEKQTRVLTCANGCDWPNCTREGCVDPPCDC